jgi:hypothetical protein
MAPPPFVPRALDVPTRSFSLGAHLTGLWINQRINNSDAALWGGGLQARYRSRGRFGLELTVDFLRGTFRDNQQGMVAVNAYPVRQGSLGSLGSSSSQTGNVTRDSVPLALSLMVYVFRNEDARHFNVYFFGGVGAVATTMNFINESGYQARQDFLEYEGHLGVGAEYRFHWFAIEANFRGLALVRDGSPYVSDDTLVPRSSWGLQGNLGIAFWF